MVPVTASDDLERVADKLAELMSRQDPGSAPGDAMRWRPPLAEPAVAAWEAEHGVVLPEDYRAFITRVAGSGTRPFHGLRELGVPDRDNDLSYLDPGRPFPYTFTRPLVCDPADEAPYWDALERGEADPWSTPPHADPCASWSGSSCGWTRMPPASWTSAASTWYRPSSSRSSRAPENASPGRRVAGPGRRWGRRLVGRRGLGIIPTAGPRRSESGRGPVACPAPRARPPPRPADPCTGESHRGKE